MNQSKYLNMSGLKDGTLYKIIARNGNYGVWIEEKKGFVISRFKFGNNFPFVEYHWDFDPNFGTAKPLEEVEKCPVKTENYTSKEMLDYLNSVDNNVRCQSCGQLKSDWITHLSDCPNRTKVD